LLTQASYAHHGLGAAVVKLFNEMQRLNLDATPATFTSILTGCSHSGLVEAGLRYFEIMQEKYSIPPSIEHYNCVIDLLGRANKLEEAEQFILQRIATPKLVTWRTLLSACRVHNDIERAKRVMDKILEINPADAPTHVMMANIYAAGNDMAAAEQIRAKMIREGIKKIPGTSTTEVNGATHTFYVNDTKHHATRAIHAEIEKLKMEAMAAGFQPDLCFVLHDVEEEVKKDLLWYHSEKLALAYALINIPSKMPIVIHKNLRVCGDCHSATKLISGIRSDGFRFGMRTGGIILWMASVHAATISRNIYL
jgi:pentatricopeptide repeat protein